jgi:hypothetical protein
MTCSVSMMTLSRTILGYLLVEYRVVYAVEGMARVDEWLCSYVYTGYQVAGSASVHVWLSVFIGIEVGITWVRQ